MSLLKRIEKQLEAMGIPSRFREYILRLQALPNTIEGIEQQIAILEDLLRALPRHENPVFWGALQNDLGLVLTNRIQGDRAENQERAIASYTAALEVYTRADFPVQWATIQDNLGTALRERMRGDRAENLERAIAAYTAALEVYTRADFPVQWATIQNNLGTAYYKRMRDGRAENLERAIAAYTAALEVYTKRDFPMDWATIQKNLGLARLHFAEVEQDRRQYHLSHAAESFGQAIDLLDALNTPSLQRARILYYLGRCYSQLGRWGEAITVLEEAREIFSRQKARPELAYNLLELGQLYHRSQNFEYAYLYLKDALRIFRRLDDIEGIAMAQESLGSLALQTARPTDAVVSLQEARQKYAALNHSKRVQAVDDLLSLAR